MNGSMLLILKSEGEGRFIALTFRGTNLFNHGYQQTSASPRRGGRCSSASAIGVEPQ